MPPLWVQHLAALYVPLSIASAVLVLLDIYPLDRRQPMVIMEAVWPLTMLNWGPVGRVFYTWFGVPRYEVAKAPMWQATFKGATHCGAGCALGDLIEDWIAFDTGFVLFGSELAANTCWPSPLPIFSASSFSISRWPRCRG